MRAPAPHEIRKALERRLFDVLKPAGVRMAEQNTKFDPKKENGGSAGIKWCRPTVKLGKPLTLEKGEDALGTRPGVFLVQLFTTPDSGVTDLEKICENIEKTFRLKVFDDVHCEEPATVSVGADPGDAWFQMNVTIPFWTWVGE